MLHSKVHQLAIEKKFSNASIQHQFTSLISGALAHSLRTVIEGHSYMRPFITIDQITHDGRAPMGNFFESCIINGLDVTKLPKSSGLDIPIFGVDSDIKLRAEGGTIQATILQAQSPMLAVFYNLQMRTFRAFYGYPDLPLNDDGTLRVACDGKVYLAAQKFTNCPYRGSGTF